MVAGGFRNENRVVFHLTKSKERMAKKGLTPGNRQ
jgi:hypothetical protein